jgi:NAD+ synthase (glutamine-hydrolysing)
MTSIERIQQALILGTRDYIVKNGFRQVVIGLSGGIDSSVVAAIAVDAVGAENVIGISMPSEFTSSGTRQDAKLLAERLGIRFYEIPIHDIFQSYLNILKSGFAGKAFDLTEENLQARIRGNILMAFSNKYSWLVLTTGNKSEVAVGYCTLYGDMSGGFAVIKDVPKTKVYEIAELINKKYPGRIPQTIIDRPPTAELRANQKDSDSLPEYPRLDPILKAYVEDHQSLSQMAKAFKDQDIVKNVIRLVDRSEYKRRQSPPGIKITPRAFGKDWRLPITNKYKEF